MRVELPAFEKIKIVVVGDVMLDRYWHGNTGRISPEAPVPVVNIQQIQERPGGAGNVALNLRALGCEVSLLGMVGEDEAANSLKDQLSQAGVTCFFQSCSNIPTITKLRIVDKNQQLIRLDFEKNLHPQHDFNNLINYYRQEIDNADAIILSDYAKGVLSISRQLIHLAKQKNVPIFVDPKTNNFDIYHSATVITPNFKEFEAVVGRCESEEEIKVKGKQLIETHQLQALLITRGEHGMTLLQRDGELLNLPAHTQEVYDVTGAGDTVISVFAGCFACGEDLAFSAMMANTAAGIVVKKMGAATASIHEIRRALQSQHTSDFGMLTEEQLLIAVADARAHNEKIVMTNGCFDILHPGHVTYLEEAKELGQRLIVAINDDQSVKRLKGQSRPVNSLEDRMRVVSSLRSVDWVVSFSEDTPARLISRVLPDVLVKGGDYKIDQIAGAEAVIENGGEVKVLKFLAGHSTANIVKKITQAEELIE